MKKLLLAGLLLAGLSGCSKKDDSKPVAPTLASGMWTLSAETIVATNKTTGVATSFAQGVIPNTQTISYSADGTYTAVADKSLTGASTNTIIMGSYVYSGGIITYTVGANTSTARIDVLTANTLTQVKTSEDANNQYVITDEFTR